MKPFRLFLLFFVLLPGMQAQPVNFPVQNYSLRDYGRLRSSQNICIVQDKKGLMYFGNANGLLQFDGRSWEFIPVKEGAYVTALAVDSSGKVYVGSQSEFGCLEAAADGRIRYRSYLGHLKEKDKDPGRILNVSVAGDQVIFQSQEKVIVLQNDSVENVIYPSTTFHTSFSVNGRYYVRERQTGLLRLNGRAFEKISGSELFADRGVFCMMPFGSGNEILIGTMELGLWKFAPGAAAGNFTPFRTSNDDLLLSAGIYGGQRLSNGMFAFNSLNSGVFLIDAAGRITARINKDMGLRVDDVKYLFEDRQQNLWLALNNGISKVAYHSPLSFYSEESGLTGTIHQVLRSQGHLYIASSSGLFMLNETEIGKRFTKLSGVEGQIWSLVETRGRLLAGGDEGLYELSEQRVKKVSSAKCRALLFDQAQQAWILGNEQGLFLYSAQWRLLKKTEEIPSGVLSLKLDPESGRANGTVVWAGTSLEGVFRITIGSDGNELTEPIGFPEGLSNEFIRPFELGGRMVFGSSAGVYAYSEKGGFELLPLIDGLVFEQQVTEIYPVKDRVWFSIANQVVLYDLGRRKAISIPFLALDKGQVHCFFQEGGICWIGSDDGLIRYEIENTSEFGTPFHALIRKVTFGHDSVAFHGNTFTSSDAANVPRLDYAYNSVSFDYIGVFYAESHKNVYSYLLEGQDTSWSKWSTETKVGFTNLREGAYTFKLRCRNIYGTVSDTAQFSFVIAAPWYRSWWACLVYVAVAVSALLGFIRLRTKKLLKEKEQLEKIVQDRTAEVIRQKDVIEEQKQLVEHKHREITDSINYAERIQRTFLASKELLDAHFKDYFVLFQPKDVVSGDFYWASKLHNGQFALVTADSTGHGVPGAIMSILNITCLEAAVEEERISEPSEILDHTRTKIIDRLRKDGSSEGGKDGMDCSILSFDLSAMRLVYSAANNPVWVVRKRIGEEQGPQLIELNPDKMPVGKHDRDQVPFSQHAFGLEPGDMIYALTDGLPDQFGGERGKKFMYKKLKELLVSISQQPVGAQKALLETTFNEWKGQLEQVDDVTLIGVRI